MIPSVKQIEDDFLVKQQAWQRGSFPPDPILLYRLDTVDGAGNANPPLFALVEDSLKNLNTVQEAVFFNVIQGDSIVEVSFFGYSVKVTKVVFSSFEEVQIYPSLTVYDTSDAEIIGVRASRVLLGLTGIKI